MSALKIIRTRAHSTAPLARRAGHVRSLTLSPATYLAALEFLGCWTLDVLYLQYSSGEGSGIQFHSCEWLSLLRQHTRSCKSSCLACDANRTIERCVKAISHSSSCGGRVSRDASHASERGGTRAAVKTLYLWSTVTTALVTLLGSETCLVAAYSQHARWRAVGGGWREATARCPTVFGA